MAPSMLLKLGSVYLGLMIVAGSASPIHANVFGEDDRQPVQSREYPWRCIGLVVTDTESGKSTGTGFLIGPNLVLTNAHCAIDETTDKAAARIYFVANRINGIARDAVHVNRVWFGTVSPGKESERDWAVLRLDRNVGDDLGWLELSAEDRKDGVLVGYSGDYRDQETPAVAPCRIRVSTPLIVHHDGDATAGSSGGPILAQVHGQTVVIALNFAEYRSNQDHSLKLVEFSDESANLALPIASLMESVNSIREEEDRHGIAELTRAADRQMDEARFDDAYRTLTQIVDACPTNSWARLHRGYALQQQGQRRQALQNYRDALRLDPVSIDAMIVRAAYHFGAGDFEQCIEITSRTLTIAKDHKAAKELRSVALTQVGQRAVATRDTARRPS